MKYIILICVREGSKGLPGKNIKPLNGIPLIGWTINIAKQINRASRIIVSTDSEEIAKLALDYGAEAPFMRPKELAQDNSPEWKSWRHALHYLQKNEGELPHAMVSIPATAPLRLSLDIENCLNMFSKGDCDAVITMTEGHRSPWYNMVKIEGDGSIGLLMPTNGNFFRRQDTPSIYDVTTVAYVLDPAFVLTKTSLFQGRVKAVEIPVERAIDIDTMFDFDIAEFLMKRRLRGK